MGHTPGPWEIRTNPTKYADLFTYDVIGQNDDYGKSGVPFSGKHLAVAMGLDSIEDAHLIAAAPDLYDACRAIADMKIDETTNHAELAVLCIAIARSTIAKANGGE